MHPWYSPRPPERERREREEEEQSGEGKGKGERGKREERKMEKKKVREKKRKFWRRKKFSKNNEMCNKKTFEIKKARKKYRQITPTMTSVSAIRSQRTIERLTDAAT